MSKFLRTVIVLTGTKRRDRLIFGTRQKGRECLLHRTTPQFLSY
ncbi:hypothetical protein [Limnospira platensis]|nr:hypothetical protein AP9108_34800 [Arthrospira sp. PCC 9108]